jgi:hypothetical protein
MTYKVAIPAGTQVQLSLEDAAGDEAWSGIVNYLLFVLGSNVWLTLSLFCFRSLLQRVLTLPALRRVHRRVPQRLLVDLRKLMPLPVMNFRLTFLFRLIVTPTLTVSQPSTNASPVGAAGNAGANPFSNDAITLRQASTPIMVLAAIAAVFATSL